MYEVRFRKQAEKYIKKLVDKKLKEKIKEAILTIAEDPTVGQNKIADLSGILCYDVHYNKTNYEIAYKYDSDEMQIVIIILVGTRENFYKELKKYI